MQNAPIKPGNGRRQLVWLIVLFLIPPVSAWLVWQYMQVHGVSFTNNAGTLISPARPLPEDALTGLAGKELALLKGRWQYVIFAGETCGQQCKDQLHLTRQTRISVNKDIQRVRRLLIMPQPPDAGFAAKLQEQHPDLVVAQMVATEQGKQWADNFVGKGFSNKGDQFFLVDPIGNLMMYYDLTVAPKGLFKDLSKLLKISQIG